MRKTYQRSPSGKLVSQPRHPVTGRRMTITADTQAEMAAKLARVRESRTDMKLGMSPEEAAHRLRPVTAELRRTVADYFSDYQKGLTCPGTIEKAASVWRQRLAPWFGKLTPWELDAGRMRAWAAELKQDGYATSTIGMAYSFLASAIGVLVPQVIPALPWGKWRPPRPTKDERFQPKRPAASTLEQLSLILHEARKHDEKKWARGQYSPRARLLLFLALTGCRHGEAAGLAWDCLEIDTDPAILWVRYQCLRGWQARTKIQGRPDDPPKDGQRRQILHPAVVIALRDQRDELKRRGWYRDDGPVWPAIRGHWSKCGKVLRPDMVRVWAKAAGLVRHEQWGPHCFRHTFATLEARGSGGDLKSTMQRTGHSDIRVLQGYLHAIGENLPPSSIPAFEARPFLPAIEVSGEPMFEHALAAHPEALAPLGDLALTVGSRQLAIEQARKDAKRELRARARDSFDVIWERWQKRGKTGELPSEVSEMFRRAYVAAYNKKKHELYTAAGYRFRGGKWVAPATGGFDAQEELRTRKSCRAYAARAEGRARGAWKTFYKRKGGANGNAVVVDESAE